MHKYIFLIAIFLISSTLFSQELKVKAKGSQTFSFEDKGGRNQAIFYSRTILEDITGVANEIKGNVSFEVENVSKTLKGKVFVTVKSIKTGIALRDEHLSSSDWLDAEKYPEISFEIKKVNKVVEKKDNKIVLNVTGDFTLKGVTKSVTSNFTLVYLDENEQTKMRAAGDLLNVRGKFNIKLSDYNVKGKAIPSKVSDDIEIEVNIVGNNK
jgi:polyisoprenoid-binding protein YceI